MPDEQRGLPIQQDGGGVPGGEQPNLAPTSAPIYNAGYAIEKLEGIQNYNSWKFAMRMTLTLEGLWDVVRGNRVDAACDQRALARICLALKPALYQYVRLATSAKEAWEKLATIFEDKGLYRRVLLLRQLHRVDFRQHADMSSYIENVMTLVQQLADIGKNIEDAEVAELLLSGLPAEYDTLVSSLETTCLTSSLSSEMVRARLLQEEHRKLDNNNGSTACAFVSKKKRDITCHYCKRVGHMKSKCFKYKRDKRNGNSSDQTNIVAALFAHQEAEWYVDSGATSHMCNNREVMAKFMDYKNSQCDGKLKQVTVANNEKLNVVGEGEICFKFGSKVRTFSNVLYVPQLTTNLLSVSKLVNSGFCVKFDRGGCFIIDNSGDIIASAPFVNGMYKLKGLAVKYVHNEEHSMLLQDRQETVSAAVANPCLPVELWHKRLGHMNYRSLCSLRANANGVMFQNQSEHEGCVPCLEGKLTAQPFPKGNAGRADKPLELVHSDLCGPMQEDSWGGARYFLSFTDDYTRKSYGYFLRSKSEVFSNFINFKAEVEKQTGLMLKCLRTDNGGEFVSEQFASFLRKEGIIHQTTVPYCPEQNGVAERLNRTLMDKARCMLMESGLSRKYWAEAVATAFYLKNRSPTKSIGGKIPEEVWTGNKVELGHLRVFGCIAYALVPPQNRRKLDPKSRRYVFVGYSETTKGYRLADPLNPKKIILARNVIFLESRFYKETPEINLNNDNILYNLMNESNQFNNSINLNNGDISSSQNVNDSNISMNNLLNNANDSSMELNNNMNNLSSSDGEFCTGSDESSDAEPAALGECVTSLPPCESCAGGEAVPPRAEVEVPAAASTRPVRTTRSVLPKRYDEYYVSMLVQNSDEPLSYDEAMSSAEAEEWQSAMKCEYDALISNGTWKLVDRPKGGNVVKCKWVFKKKFDSSGHFERFKARLVARGFSQKPGIDYSETFSPVVRHSTMRILFSLANELDLEMEHLDVTCAFLNAELAETIYMEQPVGFSSDKNKVCLLLKSIYGLKQASRLWNCKVNELLISNGYSQTVSEPCVYTKRTDDDFVIIALYVDDFYLFYSKNSPSKDKLLCLLQKDFNVKNLGTLTNCLGINVIRDKSKGIIKLNQSEYIKRLLVRFGMSECKHVSTPMSVGSKLCKPSVALDDDVYNYRQLLGSLMYLSVCTRPDISYACSQLSQFNSGFDLSHWQAAKRILRYLAGTINYSLCVIKSNKLSLSAYTDADWGNDSTDRKSYTGFVVKLGNNVVNWESRKQRCVALSSTEAEYLAITDVCKDLMFVKGFISEVLNRTLDIKVMNDNQSAHKLLEAREYCHKRTKHIDIRYHYIKDLIRNNGIKIEYLQTEKMVADVLTKPLSSIKHIEFVNKLNLM